MQNKLNLIKINFPKKLFKNFKKLKYDFDDYQSLTPIKKRSVIKKNLEILKWVKKLKKKITSKNPAVIVDVEKCLEEESNKILSFRLFNVFLSNFFGEMLVQDNNKKKVITVFDRDKTKTIKKGARYHQTHEGGSIHTDNVNIPDYWDFLFFSCLSQAPKGGHSILVDGNFVYKILKNKFLNDLKVLKQNFWFEKRGLTNDLFQSPIILKKEKKIMFRYLRPYLEAAHLKAKKLLTKPQLKSLNTLDKILENPKFQYRFKIKKFQLLITQDYRILHGRTSFKDDPKAVDFDTYKRNPNYKLKRTMDRMWIKET